MHDVCFPLITANVFFAMVTVWVCAIFAVFAASIGVAAWVGFGGVIVIVNVEWESMGF